MTGVLGTGGVNVKMSVYEVSTAIVPVSLTFTIEGVLAV